jgi:hypothetical protein
MLIVTGFLVCARHEKCTFIFVFVREVISVTFWQSGEFCCTKERTFLIKQASLGGDNCSQPCHSMKSHSQEDKHLFVVLVSLLLFWHYIVAGRIWNLQ